MFYSSLLPIFAKAFPSFLGEGFGASPQASACSGHFSGQSKACLCPSCRKRDGKICALRLGTPRSWMRDVSANIRIYAWFLQVCSLGIHGVFWGFKNQLHGAMGIHAASTLWCLFEVTTEKSHIWDVILPIDFPIFQDGHIAAPTRVSGFINQVNHEYLEMNHESSIDIGYFTREKPSIVYLGCWRIHQTSMIFRESSIDIWDFQPATFDQGRVTMKK